MPLYVMLTKLTEKGRATISNKPERIKEVNSEVEAMGAQILAQYFLLGPYDFVNVLRAPDNWNVAKVALELGSRGTLETITLPAFEIDDFITFMQMK